MNQKRILVCDDNDRQFSTLGEILKKGGYDVGRSRHYRMVVDDILEYDHVQLLILDLGFNDIYDGQKCIPDVVKRFPSIKIVVYSDILKHRERNEEALEISRELVRYPQVVGFLSTADPEGKIVFEVDRALGTKDWHKDGDIWLLHISDLQFGGDGLPFGPNELAMKIRQTIQSFVDENMDIGELPQRRFPSLAFLTGDLTQHGRPEEFDSASKFVQAVSKVLNDARPDQAGVCDRNVLLIPGNHDINWDISRARNLNLQKSEAPAVSTPDYVYKSGRENVVADLDFLQRYAWKPFSELVLGLYGSSEEWAWQPGYEIINLSEEIGLLLVCLNSSRWGIDHNNQRATVSEGVFNEIQEKMDQLDRSRTACRVLLVHHSMSSSLAKDEDRLKLSERPDSQEALIDVISRTCRFSLVITGHLHDFAAAQLDTGNAKRRLVHIGAGTARSADVKPYRSPQFNLLKLGGLSPDTNRFEKLTIYPFGWNGTIFGRETRFGDGMRSEGEFDLA